MKRAIIIIGHGSKRTGAREAMERVVSALKTKHSHTEVLAAFLEIESPTIPEAIHEVLTRGAEEVLLVPYFVQAGRHVTEHIPALLREAQAKYPKKTIQLTRHLDFDDRMIEIVEDRIREAGIRKH